MSKTSSTAQDKLRLISEELKDFEEQGELVSEELIIKICDMMTEDAKAANGRLVVLYHMFSIKGYEPNEDT